MYFDAFTAAALVDELKEKVVGGRVQDILEIDAFSLGLEIYHRHARHYLYLTAYPDRPRLHLVEGKLKRGAAQPSPLGLMLTSYLEDGRLAAVRQPVWERVVILDLVSREGAFSLVVEPMERRANILLVQEGQIKECIRRVGADENRARQLLPGQPYQAPPPQNKLDPEHVTLEGITQLLESDPAASAAQVLTRGIQGISPLLAREIVFVAGGSPTILAGDAHPRTLFEAFQGVLAPLLARQWQPGCCIEGEQVTAFAVFPLTHRTGWRAAASVSHALEAFYGAVAGSRAYDAAKKPIRQQIEQAEDKLRGKLHSLKTQQRSEEELNYYRLCGELLLTYQQQIAKQQTEFTAHYDPDAEPLIIKLDPLLTPVENAQRYFERYEKAKRALRALPELIQQTERELRYLGQLATDLDLAESWSDIGEVQETLQDGGYWRGEKRRVLAGKTRSSPLKVVAGDGTIIWVGRNSRQNEEVTFKRGEPRDLWLHVRGAPGAHVIVKTAGRPPAEEVIMQAASLAAYYSQARHSTSVEVLVTERKHVLKIKGGKLGMVRVLRQTHPSVRAVPRAPEKDDQE